MPQLAEQYRPNTMEDVVGQDKAVRALSALTRRGLGSRAILLSGATGTGKTTLARILARSIADETAMTELDGNELTPGAVRELWAGLQYYGAGKGGRALIVNECHRLSARAVTALLVELERIPSHALVVFTTTSDGLSTFTDEQLDARPFIGRCNHIQLARRDLARPFADRLVSIAVKEGLAEPSDGLLSRALRLVQDCRNSMREALMEVENGALL